MNTQMTARVVRRVLGAAALAVVLMPVASREAQAQCCCCCCCCRRSDKQPPKPPPPLPRPLPPGYQLADISDLTTPELTLGPTDAPPDQRNPLAILNPGDDAEGWLPTPSDPGLEWFPGEGNGTWRRGRLDFVSPGPRGLLARRPGAGTAIGSGRLVLPPRSWWARGGQPGTHPATAENPAMARTLRAVRSLEQNGYRMYHDGSFNGAAFNAQGRAVAALRAGLLELSEQLAALPDDGSPQFAARKRAALLQLWYLTARLNALSAWMGSYRDLIGRSR